LRCRIFNDLASQLCPSTQRHNRILDILPQL
jgi:hypothetical protein